MLHLSLLWLLMIMVYDAQQRRVPNWLVLGGAAVAIGALAMNAQPFGIGWSDALLGCVVGFGFLLLFYATGFMGAGDVKFAGALGLWVGMSPLLPIWVGASLLAGVHGLLLLALQRFAWFPGLALMLSGKPRGDAASGSRKQTRPIPFAAYLALASVVWMVWGRPS
jgi:prepilin peptidase CpaA